ncbi:hypothetical protein N8766_05500 [bacterium]|nr:hypothetical protein [Verrucomicrobiota bacterium]MDA7633545.1 hypothetical protein [bacterium]
MAKNRRRRSASKKGHPQPIQAWHFILGAIVIVLMFALWIGLRNYQ